LNHTSHGEESASGSADAAFERCGTLHLAAGSYIASIAAVPAPIAVHICTQATMTKTIAYCTQGGESIDKAVAWAADEPEGVMRG
jgi:hypothetical protein